MKINIVIGNPPYQKENQSIYNEFIDKMIGISPVFIVMITKNNWMKGNILSHTRNNMIQFGIKRIINFSLPKEIFKTVNRAISIFMLNNGYTKETHYKEIRNNSVVTDTLLSLEQDKSIVYEPIQLGIVDKTITRDDFEAYDLCKNARLFSIASNGYFMYADHTEDCIEYTNNKILEDDIEVVFLDGAHKPYVLYANRNKLPKGKEYIDSWKIVCRSKIALNEIVVSNLNVLKPGQILTNSFAIMAITNSESEIYSILKYIKTKFHRMLIRLTISDNKTAYGLGRTIYVPLQNFTSQSDIDWSQSVENIDRQLYKKYNLNQEEIDYIESTLESI